jgi:pimeloyl-ACP methyl ester carboxylesterase
MVRPFTYEAAQDQLDDLTGRLALARLPATSTGGERQLGISLASLESMMDYWRLKFDWRAVERRVFQLPNFMADIDGHDIHFLHVRGSGSDSYPLILTHGWPSSFLEFLEIIPLLTQPHPRSGEAPVTFDLVIPSLPGYGFSRGPVGSYTDVADLWVKLMTETLGYQRFGAHGGDIGAGITSRMGLYHRDHVEAIHVLSAPKFIRPDGESTAEERLYLEYVEWWEEHEGAYAHQQRTRPHTLGVALNDSPAGLAAWILEKWQAWSDSGTNIEMALGADALLANITLYWLTSTITSSMEMYWHNRNGPRAPWPDARVDVPSRLFLTTEAVDLIPESAASRVYADLSYGRAPVGGHFLAAEQPAILAEDIRRFFSPFMHAR